MFSAETKEQTTAVVLATLGAIKSIPELVDAHPEARVRSVEESHSATLGWAAIGAGVLAWDLMAPETLSEAVDRSLKKHRTTTVLAVSATALHLLNLIPERVDPIHQIGKRARNKIRG